MINSLKRISPTFGQFLLVGLSGTLVNLACLWLLVRLGVPQLWAALAATEFSIINNFFWNDFWTFQHHPSRQLLSRWQRFGRFQIVASGTAVLTLGLFGLLSGPFQLYYLLAQFIAIGLATILNFALNSRLTWGVNHVLKEIE